jgi:hypothetical protein
MGSAIAQAVIVFQLRSDWFDLRSGYVGFVMDKDAMDQVSTPNFGLP